MSDAEELESGAYHVEAFFKRAGSTVYESEVVEAENMHEAADDVAARRDWPRDAEIVAGEVD